MIKQQIYSVIQEEISLFQKMKLSVIVGKTIHMNMRLILIGVTEIQLFESRDQTPILRLHVE